MSHWIFHFDDSRIHTYSLLTRTIRGIDKISIQIKDNTNRRFTSIAIRVVLCIYTFQILFFCLLPHIIILPTNLSLFATIISSCFSRCNETVIKKNPITKDWKYACATLILSYVKKKKRKRFQQSIQGSHTLFEKRGERGGGRGKTGKEWSNYAARVQLTDQLTSRRVLSWFHRESRKRKKKTLRRR